MVWSLVRSTSGGVILIIFRALCRELYASTLTISALLVAIVATTQVLRYLHNAAKGKITVVAVLKMLSLQAPLLLGYLLPFALFLSVLLVIARWQLDHEFVVLQACGVSHLKLYGWVLGFATMIAIVVAVLMLWLQPILQYYRKEVLFQAKAKASIAKMSAGQFREVAQGVTFYAGDVSRLDGSLHNIFIVRRVHGKHPAWQVTFARQGREAKDPVSGEPFLLLDQGYRYEGVPGEPAFTVTRYRRYGIGLARANVQRDIWPYGASTIALWEARAQDPKARAFLQWRIAMPVSTLLLALLALSLSEINPRKGRFLHLIPAVILYTGYIQGMFLVRHAIKHGASVLDFWYLHGVVLGVVLLLMGFRRYWPVLRQWRINRYAPA